MQKCDGCNHFSDKCKNKNSKNYNKFARDIKKCKTELIDKSINNIISKKRADDSI